MVSLVICEVGFLFDVARNIPIKTIPQPIKILKVISSSKNILPHRIPNIGRK
jgi:hypothetical protein